MFHFPFSAKLFYQTSNGVALGAEEKTMSLISLACTFNSQVLEESAKALIGNHSPSITVYFR